MIFKKRWFWIALLPLSFLLAYLSSFFPEAVERVYSRGIYPVIANVLGFFFSWIPFSLSEFLLIALCLWLFWRLFRNLRKLFKREEKFAAVLCRSLLNGFSILGGLAFFFIFLWGLNYQRQPLAETLGFSSQAFPVSELEALCNELAQKCNSLRATLPEDREGALQIPNGISSVFERAPLGYGKAAEKYSFLKARYSSPKKVLLSVGMSYWGISGVFNPFTSEANVNAQIPDCELPPTSCHEMAHRLGFAREDEANYLAYLACSSHPDLDFQYSGALFALNYSLGELLQYDRESGQRCYQTLSEKVKRDWKTIREFWDRYQSPIREVSESLNDMYLKSQGQDEGIHSYGRMVDLLLAERQTKVK